MRLLLVLFAAWKAYRAAGECGTEYVAVTSHGIPYVSLFLGTGREAWRISQRAIEELQLEKR